MLRHLHRLHDPLLIFPLVTHPFMELLTSIASFPHPLLATLLPLPEGRPPFPFGLISFHLSDWPHRQVPFLVHFPLSPVFKILSHCPFFLFLFVYFPSPSFGCSPFSVSFLQSRLSCTFSKVSHCAADPSYMHASPF